MLSLIRVTRKAQPCNRGVGEWGGIGGSRVGKVGTIG